MNDFSNQSPSQVGSGPVIAAIIATKLALGKLVKDETNPFHRYKYVPIDTYYEHVASCAASNGLTWRTNIVEIAHFIETVENGKTQHILRFDFSIDLMHSSGMVWENWQKLTIFHPTQGAQTTGSAMSYAEKLMMRTTFSVATSEDDVDAKDSSFQGNLRKPSSASSAPSTQQAPVTAKRLSPAPKPKAAAKPIEAPQPILNDDNSPDPGQQQDDVGHIAEGGLSWTNYNEEPELRSGQPKYDLDPLPKEAPAPQPTITLPEGLAELSEVTGLPVITDDRSAQAGQGDMIVHILTAFLPSASTEEELVTYWKDNHDALTTLKGVDATAHSKIILAFRDRRAEITAANADS
jgi:hypothetical protein